MAKTDNCHKMIGKVLLTKLLSSISIQQKIGVNPDLFKSKSN